jgi:hypothetical protein
MILSIKKFLQIILFLLYFLPFIVSAQINRNDEKLEHDLESLGLDNIESKPEFVKTKAKIKIDKKNTVNKRTSQAKKNVKKEPKKLTPHFSNDKNLKLVGQKNIAKTEKISQKSKETAEQQESKSDLSKTDLQELEELQKIYVAKLQENQADYEDEDLDFSENILPHKKNLHTFATEELPPIPILNRSRSPDNMHIPYVTTPKENIEVMFLAIKLQDVNFFNEIFKYVQNPNIINDAGDSVLTAAMFSGNYSMIASALAKGADPNMPNKLGYNPLTIAIEINDFTMVEMLIKNKADLFYKDAFNRTYLMQAARVGSLSIVDLLIRFGVNINAVDNDGLTALAIAQKYKQDLVMQYLIKNGAK